MPKKAAGLAIIVTLLVLLVGVAFSHDIWLSPEGFILDRGDTLVLRQLAGTELDTEHDLPLDRLITRRFELITPTGSFDLLRQLPDPRAEPVIQPVLKQKLDFEGLALVAMEHAFIYTEWTREEFLEYLEHEEYEIAKFGPHMGADSAESERYARALKSLVQVGTAAAGDLHKRVLGQRIEILLLQNPYVLDPGDDLDVQVLFQGAPLGGQRVMAYHRGAGEPVTKVRALTNEDGIARFRLDQPGQWLIRLVHLLPCGSRPDIDCSDVDWESHWASYTFELR